MNNMLTRGILRLSKRSKSGSVCSDSQSLRSESVASYGTPEPNGTPGTPGTPGNDEWTKYDERLIDCINRSDIGKLKETLKKKGVSPVKVSRVGKTAIHVAVKKRCMEGVDVMLLEHPDLSCIDMQGRTVYHIASLSGDTIMLKKLLDYSKWNLHVKDVKGMTAVHYAVQSGELACVKLLVDNESPLDIKDAEGRIPLLLAVTEDRQKIATLLIERGVGLNEQDKQGRSAIVIAVSLGMTQIVSLLLSKDADKSVNRTSLNLDKLASDAGHTDIIEILANAATKNEHPCDGSTDTNVHTNGEDLPVNGHNGVNGYEGANGHSDHNGHNGVDEHYDINRHSDVNVHNGSGIDILVDGSHITENGHCDKLTNGHSDKLENGNFEKLENSYNDSSSPIPTIQLTQPSATLNRRSVYNDDSLTSAIIESLMGFDGKSDTVSETSVTEDQLHLHEKGEQEKKELNKTLEQKELRIEELQAEIDSLKNKVSREMELRFSAEKEVQQLKLDLEGMCQRSECEAEQASMVHDYASSDERLGDNESSGEDVLVDNHEDDDNETVNNDEADENSASEHSEEVRTSDEIDVNKEGASDADRSRDSDSDVETPHGNHAYQNGNFSDSDSDDSVSLSTGYRKKSLGTAKQHINMLEERILCLEDDLACKCDQISQLESQCKNAKELVDLNNNTTVNLEIHNELKSDSRKERTAFKEKIMSLEEQVRQLEQTVEGLKKEKIEEKQGKFDSPDFQLQLQQEMETNKNLRKQVEELHNEINILKAQLMAARDEEGDSEPHQASEVECDVDVPETQASKTTGIPECVVDDDDIETKLQCDVDGHAELQGQVVSLQQKADKLQEQLSEYDETLEETLHCYRNNLISLYQNNLDSRLEEILASIVKLRGS